MQSGEAPKFFGRRKGRTIRKAKQSLTDKFLPKIRVGVENMPNLPDCFDCRLLLRYFLFRRGLRNGTVYADCCSGNQHRI